ncbi:MAG TPA: hypothetical protein DIC22_11685 [Chitinophagaceae bacterium]|nr:hypothetical protein [Chitinophagaceae bacterium]
MKKHINPFKTLALLALMAAPFLGRASDGDNIEKKKLINKSYTVGPDDRLSIENSFGNVIITTWDKNEIQVSVEIGVRAPSDEKAQLMLDQIKVTDNQGGQEISFKTDIGSMGKGKEKGNWSKNEDSRKFYVDYKIVMPARNPLRVENSFGKISVPDFSGIVSLTSKFGELSTGKLANAKLVHVEFGKAEIGILNNADVILKFNSKSNVAGLGGNSKVHIEFCSQVNLTIDNTVSDLAVFESYSNIHLKAPDNLSAQFDIHTNFGNFKNTTEFNIAEDNDDDTSGPKFDKDYSGSAGSGAAKIKIKSSFGNVRLASIHDKSADNEDAHDEDQDDEKGGDKVNL